MKNYNVPLWEKENLTMEQASVLYNVGINRIRELSDKPDCDFVLWVGNKRLIKRKRFSDYLARMYSI